MFNPRGMKNKTQGMFQSIASNLIQSQLQKWQEENPMLYKEAVALVSGKTEDQLKVIAENMAKSNGMSISQVAQKLFGFKI